MGNGALARLFICSYNHYHKGDTTMKRFVVIQGSFREIIEADKMFTTEKGEVHFVDLLSSAKVAVVLTSPGMVIRELKVGEK